MANGLRWARLYGGSAILILAKDGGDFSVPLNLNNLDVVEELRILDLTSIKATDRYYTDPTLINFGQLEYYNIQPPGRQSFDVHESRLIPISGDPMPITFTNQNQISWAGKSALEGCVNDIARYEQALEWSLRLLERKQQGIYNMAGLGEMVANGDELTAVKRINMVDMVRSNLNSIMIDKEDTYSIENLGLDGLENLINEYQIAISAASNIQIPILFGKSTTGLNATGSGDLEAYYGMVKHLQTSIAYPVLEKLTSILWLQTSLKGPIPDEWHVEFNPLWVPTEQEQANTDNLKANANNTEVTMLITLMTNGILDPEEVRKIVVNKYAEYGFPDTLPSSGEDINYAEMVDMQSLLNGETPANAVDQTGVN
jgi:phage-related protein (TIGR01555 family)